MININIPRTSTASFQPDYTKAAEFPGFTFYHSLKEWYFIYEQNNIKSFPDKLLDDLNLKGTFSFLIGSNSNNIFIGQCETASLAKLQIDPNTGEQISFEIINIKSIIQQQVSSTQDVLLTGGYVKDNTLVLIGALSQDETSNLTNPTPIIIISQDNGGTWEARNMISTPLTTSQIPIGITRINFYDTYYYTCLVRSYETNESYFYIGSEEEVLTNNDTLYYHQTVSGALSPTFNTDRRLSINVQLHWNHNSLHFLNDDRRTYLIATTHLHKKETNYQSPYPIPDFEFVQNTLTSSSYTQIESIRDNSTFNNFSQVYKKLDTISNGASSESNIQSYAKGLVWDELSSDFANTTEAVLDFKVLNDEIIKLTLENSDGGLPEISVSRQSLPDLNVISTNSIEVIPMSRFNTGGIHWGTSEVVNPLPSNWAPNSIDSQWISIDADTNLIDYGPNDFDYPLTLSIELPEDVTLSGQVFYADEILDIIVDGVSTSNSYSANGLNGLPISLNLSRGVHTVTFNMRKIGASGSSNPTGLRLEWSPIRVGEATTESLDIEANYTDILLDIDSDRLYVSLGRGAWVLEYTSLKVISYIDLHAEPLVFNPPFPPNYDPLVITGVTDNTHVPTRWKWLKNFNDVYIYNSFHEDTFSSNDSKEFYMWVVDEEDPSYHTMFSAFSLTPSTIMKLEYFYDINQQLHLIVLKDTNGFNRTYQYRLNGLAQFNQLTQGETLVGTLNFNNVYVDREGSVYITESAEPNFSVDNNTLFVYKNDNAEDLSAGSYLIEIDDLGNAFDADRASKITTVPSQHSSMHPENWSKSLTYTEIPGDYTAKVLTNSDKFRDETSTELESLYGATINFSSRTDIDLSSGTDIILKAEMDLQRHWTYFLIYNDALSRYKLQRARALFYPST